MNEFTLDLSDYGTREGNAYFRPGYHVITVEGAELNTNKNTGVVSVKVSFSGDGGAWKFNEFFTVKHPDVQSSNADTRKKAKNAVEIGMTGLKSLMVYSGLPNPEQFSIDRIKGVRIGAALVRDDNWVDNDGVTRRGGPRLPRFGKPFFSVTEVDDLIASNAPHPALEEQAKKDALFEANQTKTGGQAPTAGGGSFVPPPPVGGGVPF